MSRRVVITGLGTVNPLGNNVHDFWEGVKENRLGISKVEQFVTVPVCNGQVVGLGLKGYLYAMEAVVDMVKCKAK